VKDKQECQVIKRLTKSLKKKVHGVVMKLDIINVLKKFKKRKSMYFDQVVEIGHYQLGIKGKKVLVVYDEDIDDFYHHYINYIQK
jgi:hypothetical protein